ncbi:MAG TPA: cysteine dioxygenase family protein [Gaiellaceae bacterium]|nr:cysteine dioxygenase family protein [Gaiellaceae bacterium]
MAKRVPSDAVLPPAELARLATTLAEERRLWEHLVRHVPEERYFVELFRDAHLDVWLICWLNQQDTGFHDHDVSAGAVHVCDGVLAEDCFVQDGSALRTRTREHRAGTCFDFDASYVHRMRHVGGALATSIHCYSPALWRLGHYDIDEEGTFRRTSITYADEMWTGRIVGERTFTP